MILIIIKFNGLRSCIKHSKKILLSECTSFFNPLLSVWKSDEILFLVCDIFNNYSTSARWI